MGEIKINAKPRAGKSSAYKHDLRSKGYIPAVIYGQGINSEPIELNAKDLENILHKKGKNVLIDLVLKGQEKENKYVVMVKEVQRDPLHRDIVHADLCKISMSDKIHTPVPVQIIGETAIQKKGGVLQTGLREIEVECLPTNIPDSITVDVSNLELGKHLSVADLPGNTDYRILSDGAAVIVTAATIRAAAEPEEAIADHKEEAEEEEKEKEG